MDILYVVFIIVGVAIGYFVSSSLLKKQAAADAEKIKQKALQMQAEAEAKLKDAESKGEILKQEKLLQAKEKFLQLKTEHEKQLAEKNNAFQERQQKLVVEENKLKQKDTTWAQKIEEAQKKQAEADSQKVTENIKEGMKLPERVKANVGNLEGKTQEVFGNLTGDRRDQIAGKAKQVESKTRNLIEDAKDKFNDMFQ